jgi:hypothetical protein
MLDAQLRLPHLAVAVHHQHGGLARPNYAAQKLAQAAVAFVAALGGSLILAPSLVAHTPSTLPLFCRSM